MSLEITFRSNGGSRNSDEGSGLFQKDNLFILADGVGAGSLRGTAKELICRIISKSFFRLLSEDQSPGNALANALEEANKEILKENEKIEESMAASVSVVYVRGRIMYFTHLGDSQIYSFHEEKLKQLTKNYTLLEEGPFVLKRTENPRITKPFTDGLGIHDKLVIKVKKNPLHKKEIILITSKEITERLSSRDIRRHCLKTDNPEKLCRGMIELAKRKGGNGNMNVGVMRFEGKSKNLRNSILVYFALFLILFIATFSYFLKYRGGDPGIGEVQKTRSVEGTQVLKEQKVDPVEKETVSFPQVIAAEEKISSKITQSIRVQTAKAGQIKTATQHKDAELFDEIHAFVTQWKAAWEKTAGKNGDMNSYIYFYSKDFKSSVLSRDGWKRDKERKGRKKDWVRLEISDIKIFEPKEDNLVEIRFSQRYSSSNFSERSIKRLTLRKEGAVWKILSERNVKI